MDTDLAAAAAAVETMNLDSTSAGDEGATTSANELPPLADGEYDVIVLGTGLVESVLSGILSVDGYKVLHADQNQYYGGTSASLNLQQLVQRFRGAEAAANAPLPAERFGDARRYNVDLIPKFIMGNGKLVKLLLHCGVERYLDFVVVDGSFVYSGSRPHKVPSTATEALRSSLLGWFEKTRCSSFFAYINRYKPENRAERAKLRSQSMRELFKSYGLQNDTIEFIGHVLAQWRDDSYLDRPAEETVLKIQMYAYSLLRYEHSPYLYPKYGLGELPQSFSRLSAVHGGTFMLNTPIDQILYDENGRASGVVSGGRRATCKRIVAAPEYFVDRCHSIGKVVRCYCVLAAPPPNTRECRSSQIVVPAAKAGRKHDIYVLVLSSEHDVCPKGLYIALVSTTVETDKPAEEVAFGVRLLGNVLESFLSVDEQYEPNTDGKADNVFLSRSYDATTHFETTVDDIFDLYKRMFDKALVLNAGRSAEQRAQ